jgi:ureidoacrylate peracid hydrolase
MRRGVPMEQLITVQTEPKPLEIDLRRTAVWIVDMQNAYVKKGGMMDLLGIDISGAQKIIEPINRIISAARANEIKIVYTITWHKHDNADLGGPDCAPWHKNASLRMPERKEVCSFGHTWGAEIVDELKPREGDIVTHKIRYDAFFQTDLEATLTSHNIKYLIAVGTATNICVEDSVRGAFSRGYFPILTTGATAAMGPPFMQQAAEFNIKACYGWVADTEQIIEAMNS